MYQRYSPIALSLQMQTYRNVLEIPPYSTIATNVDVQKCIRDTALQHYDDDDDDFDDDEDDDDS